MNESGGLFLVEKEVPIITELAPHVRKKFDMIDSLSPENIFKSNRSPKDETTENLRLTLFALNNRCLIDRPKKPPI